MSDYEDYEEGAFGEDKDDASDADDNFAPDAGWEGEPIAGEDEDDDDDDDEAAEEDLGRSCAWIQSLDDEHLL